MSSSSTQIKQHSGFPHCPLPHCGLLSFSLSLPMTRTISVLLFPSQDLTFFSISSRALLSSSSNGFLHLGLCEPPPHWCASDGDGSTIQPVENSTLFFGNFQCGPHPSLHTLKAMTRAPAPSLVSKRSLYSPALYHACEMCCTPLRIEKVPHLMLRMCMQEWAQSHAVKVMQSAGRINDHRRTECAKLNHTRKE